MIAFFAALLIGSSSSAPPTKEMVEVAVVANALEGSVSLIDLETLRVAKTLSIIPDGPRPNLLQDPAQFFGQPILERTGGLNYAQDTDVSSDGLTLYVSRGNRGDVAAFDLKSGERLWRRAIAGVRADHMDYDPDGNRLFVSATVYGGDVVDVLDAETGKRLGRIGAGPWPHDVHVHDGAVYVASLGDMLADLDERGAADGAYTIAIADAETFKPVRAIAFEAGVRPFVIAPDAGLIFAQLSNTHDLVARDLATGDFVRRATLPVQEGVTEDDWDFEAPHHGLAMTQDERLLCVAGRASDYAAIVEASSFELVKTIPVGNAPSWAAITPDDRTCVLPNTRSDDVSIIDLDTGEERARIAVGDGPKHVTIAKVARSVLD